MSRLFLPLLLISMAAAGCMTYAGDILERPGRDTREVHRYRDQVDRDVYRYVRWMNRELDLYREQARDLDRVLRQRTHNLLDHTRTSDYYRVYPFPRQDWRAMSRTTQRWWEDTDRLIERRLTYRQGRRYRYLVENRRQGRRDDRPRRRRGDRWDDDDRYEDDGRYDNDDRGDDDELSR